MEREKFLITRHGFDMQHTAYIKTDDGKRTKLKTGSFRECAQALLEQGIFVQCCLTCRHESRTVCDSCNFQGEYYAWEPK